MPGLLVETDQNSM